MVGSFRICWGFKFDPGPCPVDDTPHTACTTESVAALKAAADLALGPTTGTRLVVPVEPPAALRVAFTTATYRRERHGSLIGIPTRRR